MSEINCHVEHFLPPSSMSYLATFCDVPVATTFNGNATSSSVSLDWIINSGLRTRSSQVSGLLMLPCDVGVISMRLNNIPVTASLASDLVLGLDWFKCVQDSAPELTMHLSHGGPLDLRHLQLPTIRTDSGPSSSTGALWPLCSTIYYILN